MITNEEADIYFESRYDSIEWETTTELNKTKALATATRLMNALNYLGTKTNKNQPNEFPRDDETTVPIAIKDACCEIAFALIGGRDVEFDRELDEVQSVSMSIAKISNDSSLINQARLHNIPSSIAWGLIRPYLRDGSEVILNRVD